MSELWLGDLLTILLLDSKAGGFWIGIPAVGGFASCLLTKLEGVNISSWKAVELVFEALKLATHGPCV